MSQGKFENLVGKRFGLLVVLNRAGDHVQPSGQHKRVWHCICDCGNECDVRASDLKSGNTRSCGCLQQEVRGKPTFQDLIGQRFGKLLVISRLPNHKTPSGQTKTMWRCRCECGNECDVYAEQLKNGKTSCGCERAKAKPSVVVKRKTLIRVKQKGSQKSAKIKTRHPEHIESEIAKQQKKAEARAHSLALREEKKKTYRSTNCLALKNPDLATEWNYEKNETLTPFDVTPSDATKVWWLGKCGHEWEATVGSRSRGNGCPFCAHQLVLKGYNDLATTHPSLLEEWDYEKNEITPYEVMAGSNKLVWWKCKKGHSYRAKLSFRSKKLKEDCPFCRSAWTELLPGFNDLQTLRPDLAEEWDQTKNEPLLPSEVLFKAYKKVWWICKKGHSYSQSVYNRVNNGANCPYCSHQKLLPGFNDFATLHPELLSEWDYEKNSVLPSEIGTGTHQKIWWVCPFGHSYQAYPSNRAGLVHSGCPVCDKENHTSFPEQALFFYVLKAFPDAVNGDRSAVGMELDIYIPSLNVAIEYDGATWHSNNQFEKKKNIVCKKAQVRLIRIREKGLSLYDDCLCVVRENAKSNESLSSSIREVLGILNPMLNIDIDVERDSSLIYESYVIVRKQRSLQSLFPDLAGEWHPSKNGKLTPEMVAPATNKRVWWLGECGHEWQMAVSTRTTQNCGCPICSGKKVLAGFNDLQTSFPNLCEEWDFDKNSAIGLSPDSVSPHSDKKAWWKCKKCGFSYRSKIDGRTRMGAGCPQCGKLAIAQAKWKPVKCIETGKIYLSLMAAEEDTGINRMCIGNCCRGKQSKAGGYHWMFVK